MTRSSPLTSSLDRLSKRRLAAVAGTFYPAEPTALRARIDALLHDAAAAHTGGETPEGQPKALIAPHAGYAFSGPVAASAYHHLQARCSSIQRVVLVGPAHHVPVIGVATTSSDAFATPLGDVPVDRAAVAHLLTLDEVNEYDAAHAPEHGLEVHLPFLMHALGCPTTAERSPNAGFCIVPLLVGQTTDAQITRALQQVWGGQETLIVASSDLSHFHDYDTACQRDRQTAAHILAGDVDAIRPTDACGHAAIRGLMRQAHAHRLHPRLLDLRSSGDTAGSRDEVVGYASFIYT